MRAGFIWAAAALFLPAMNLAQGFLVDFEQSVYYTRPLEPVGVRVEFRSTDPLALFSFGVRLVYLTDLGDLVGQSGIQVPAELDFNGVQGAGALLEAGPGFAAAKGTVDFFVDPTPYYTGKALATFTLVPRQMGAYDLALELYRTLGPAEQVFVTADGTVLDPQLRWGAAVLEVVPEPAPLTLFLLGGLALNWRLRSASHPVAAQVEHE